MASADSSSQSQSSENGKDANPESSEAQAQEDSSVSGANLNDDLHLTSSRDNTVEPMKTAGSSNVDANSASFSHSGVEPRDKVCDSNANANNNSESSVAKSVTSASQVSIEKLVRCQPTKRRPDKELTHENWDQEDEPEEKGEFKKANEDQLKDRKILTAKRKVKSATSTTNNNPFGGLALNVGTAANPASLFNFSNIARPTTVPTFDFSSVTSSSEAKSSMTGSKTSEKDEAVSSTNSNAESDASKGSEGSRVDSSGGGEKGGGVSSATTV